MNNKLAILDKNGKAIGFKTKEECHLGKGIFHLAFYIYIFNKKGQLLIQQRSKEKKLWPLYWSNSCCSHQRSAGDCIKEAEERLKEELGITTLLKKVDSFKYGASYKNIGSENELCAILIGEYSGRIKKNPKEVADWEWVDPQVLLKNIENNHAKYTPWFKIGLKRYFKILENSKAAQKELSFILNDTAKKIDPEIKKLLISNVLKKFHNVVNYQISVGGKRLRPALAILSCFLLGGKIKDVSGSAAGLEILHNCTLIVDDIIDHSQIRRGKPTVLLKFGKSIAECMGLDYLAAAFEGTSRSKNPAIISEIFAKTVKILVNGEILDILFEQRGREEEPYIVKNRYNNIRNQEYNKMVAWKTAALFQACCEVGAISAGASKKQLKALKNYGFNLGMAFQIRDDILDIFGKGKDFGKKIGKDIKERKLGNIVILSSLKKLLKPEKDKILKIMRKKEIKSKDIKEATDIIKTTDAFQKSCRLAEEFGEKAKEDLRDLPKNKWNRILENLVDFVVWREK